MKDVKRPGADKLLIKVLVMQAPMQKLGESANICNPRGRNSDRRILGNQWPASLAKLESFEFNER